jgi:hypothetical protein
MANGLTSLAALGKRFGADGSVARAAPQLSHAGVFIAISSGFCANGVLRGFG